MSEAARRLAAAGAALRAGRSREAEAELRAVLAAVPGQPQALNDLGVLLLHERRFAEALPLLQQLVAADPSRADSHFNFGQALRALGHTAQAVAAFRAALALAPLEPENVAALATMLQEAGAPEEALATVAPVARRRPGHSSLALCHSAVLRELNRYAEAEEVLRTAVEAGADHDVRATFAQLLWELGRMDDAAAVARRCLELGPRPEIEAGARSVLARCTRQDDAASPNLAAMQRLVEREQLNPLARLELRFALGKAYDDLGDVDRAFAEYRAGNALCASLHPTRARGWLREYRERLERCFDPELLARAREVGSETRQPVFVVGMPRSGTTLCEQIIAAHPAAAGAGELQKLRELTHRASGLLRDRGLERAYPEALRDATPEELRGLAGLYLRTLVRAAGRPAERIVDKMPLNFLHLGLIALLFPRATVVHCSRGATDNCLSMYFTSFQPGNFFANDLAHLGEAYRDYHALMRFWREVLPIRIHEHRYEDVVADPEGRIRALIDAVGLPWDDACLSYDTAARGVRTPSAWQVRQPIYKSSVERWRRYERHLGPLREALGDLA